MNFFICTVVLLDLISFRRMFQVLALTEGDELMFSGNGSEFDDTDSSGADIITHPERAKSNCEKMRNSILEQKQPVPIYIPTCEVDGSYSQLQCQHDQHCWCVNSEGIPVQGSEVAGKHTVKCPAPSASSGTSGSDFSYTHSSALSSSSSTEKRASTVKPSVAADQDDFVQNAIEDEDTQTREPDLAEAAGLFSEPFLVAGIICGAVMGLLCAMLLVMFIVYRMKKKDEGSYSLDEPQKKSPTHGGGYTRANDKEFFA